MTLVITVIVKVKTYGTNTTQMLDIIIREETLLNVIRSVTRNGKSILLTTVLALILVYLFSVVGYLFLRGLFVATKCCIILFFLLFFCLFCLVSSSVMILNSDMSLKLTLSLIICYVSDNQFICSQWNCFVPPFIRTRPQGSNG